MKRLLRDYVAAVGSYTGLIALGLVFTMTISSALGYLPYSDRPGPGWTEPFFSFALLGFYLSWSVLLLLPTAIYGTVIFAWLRVLNVLAAPRVIIRVVGALSAGVVAFFVSAGVGWYISIATFPVLVAAGLGAGWGAVLLPRYLGSPRLERPRWARWPAICVVLLAGSGGLYWTFLAPRYGQNLHLSIVRVASPDERLRGERRREDLDPYESALLDSLLPNARLRALMTGVSSTGDGSIKARMLIVITAPLTTEARLREPKGVSVVYIQRRDGWDVFPPNAPTIKHAVTLGPGSKPNEVTVTWAGSRASTIRWGPD